MFHQHWETEHKGHKLRVENNWFGSTKLFIDDSLADESFGFLTVNLYGKIEGNKIKVFVHATLLSVKCKIFANNKLIFPQDK